MKLLLVLIFVAALHAQPVAIVNGKPVSQAELDAFKSTLPPQMLPMLAGKTEDLLRYYGFISRMAELAEKAGLADQSPYKEQLAVRRKLLLGEAMGAEYSRDLPITPADEQKFYDQHKELFQQAHVLTVFVPTKSAAETAAAKAKADDLWKQIQSGVDFALLAKQNPAGATSADWPGDSSPLRRYDDNIPSQLRNAVFAAKPGEVTRPIALPHGVYLFRVERIVAQPLSEVRGYAAKAFSDDRYQTWMAGVNQSVTVEKPAPPK